MTRLPARRRFAENLNGIRKESESFSSFAVTPDGPLLAQRVLNIEAIKLRRTRS